MTDFASLGIRIDSSQAVKATSDLDKLADVGDKVAKSIADAADANAKFQKTASDGAKAAKANSDSIDKYVQSLQKVAATNGLGARETKLYDLALQGASKSQLAAADAAIKLDEGYKRGVAIGEKLRAGFIDTAKAAATFAAALAAAGVGGKVLFDKIADSIGKYQELSEKTGDTASNIQSLQQASDLSGVSLDTVASASVRLTAALSKTDDESKLVAKGIKALGLNFDDFKKLAPADQFKTVATAMSGFADGAEKSATAVAVFGKAGAELIPFFNDLAESGDSLIKLTDEQIKQADDYTKAQAKLRGEITQLAQVIVVNSIPAVQDLTGAFKDVIEQVAGVEKGATTLGNNNSIQQFAEDGARFLATLADYAIKVGEAFHAVGESIGAAAAASAAAAKGDFQEAINIGKDYLARSKTFFDAPSIADALDARIAARKAAAAQRRVEDRGFTPGKPTIDTSPFAQGKPKAGRDTAGQEAKAQLAFDLEDIRKAQDAITNTIANGEKLLEARRAANLVTEAAYWDQKKQFLIDNNTAQQQGLQKELDRLQQEQLSGKDAINNARKILDVEAKLAKVRQDGATSLQVLAIQQADALDKIAIKYENAQKAAQDYVDTITRANQRELDGLGKGNLQRDIDSRKNQRDDQFLQRSDQLRDQLRRGDFGTGKAAQDEFEKYLAVEKDAHTRGLAEDERYWREKLAKMHDWTVGASEAFQNYIDDANNAMQRTQEFVTSGLNGFTDSLTAFIEGDQGASFKDLGKALGTQLLHGMIETNITKPLAEFLQSSVQGASSGGVLDTIFGAVFGGKKADPASGVLGSATARGATPLNPLYVQSVGLDSLGSSGGGDALGDFISKLGSSFAGAGSAAAVGSSLNFAEGGFTGAGGKYQPAGIVHAGEYVVTAENTKRLGLSFLERLNKRGYADGGFVGAITGTDLGRSEGAHITHSASYNMSVEGQVDRRTRSQIMNDLSLAQQRGRRLK